MVSRDYEKRPYAFMRVCRRGYCVFLLLLRLSAFGHFPVVALCICWGLAITIFNLVFQSEIIRLAPEATAIAMSVYSGIYNVGIGAGALVGGFVCTHGFDCLDRLCRGVRSHCWRRSFAWCGWCRY